MGAGYHFHPHIDFVLAAIDRDQLLGHQELRTTQMYARIHAETLYRQFKRAMSSLDAVAFTDWPQPGEDIAVAVEEDEWIGSES